MQYQNILVIASALLLFLYFFTRPEIDTMTFVIVITLWLISMIWDIKITLQHDESFIKKYEQSMVLVFLYSRYSRGMTFILVMLAEASCVVFLPLLIFFDITHGVIIAYFLSLLHACALYGNEKFTRN